jgi:hypothetical protein
MAYLLINTPFYSSLRGAPYLKHCELADDLCITVLVPLVRCQVKIGGP